MLQDDALMAVNYYVQQKEIICDKLAVLSAQADAFSRGSIVLLHSLLAKIDYSLKKGRLTLQAMDALTSNSASAETQDETDNEDSSDFFSEDSSDEDL